MLVDTQKQFNDYSSYIRKTFGERVQKVTIDTGYSCPNRDGSKGRGGCTYCNINTIRAGYAGECGTITEQLQRGAAFFENRKKGDKFLAYFQSYTNTYSDFETLRRDYAEALAYPGVVGLVIGTRPDCISNELADYLEELARKHYVSVELGIESTDEDTLKRVNRCHTFVDTVNAINLLAGRSIHIGGHLILGIPWESESVMLSHADKLSSLPINSLKLHHLQVLKHTMLAKEHLSNPFTFLQPEEYLYLVIRFLERCNPSIIFQRFIAEAPQHLLIAPEWGGIRNYRFADYVNRKMIDMGSWQGKFYKAPSSTC